MGKERRYSGQEIDEILARATQDGTGREPAERPADGLTLAELRDIGREVGISGHRIDAAAHSLDRGSGVDRSFGIPLAVSRTVPLPRAPTEPEWEALVSDLRATFGAAGRIHRDGNLRGWTNGNLHAFVEPDGGGHRLRMGSTKGNARGLFAVGGGMLGMSAVLGTLTALGADVPLAGAGSLLAMSAGTFLAGAAGLPRWARARLRQMDEIGRRTVERLGSRPPEDLR